MAIPAKKYPEVRGAVNEYRRLTPLDEIRMAVDEINDARRLRKAREAYVREEGYNKAAAEYEGQLSAKDEQNREQLSAKDEQNREQLSAKDEQIRRLEEENRRLRGE
jgi:hypothetical protein